MWKVSICINKFPQEDIYVIVVHVLNIPSAKAQPESEVERFKVAGVHGNQLLGFLYGVRTNLKSIIQFRR